MVLVRRWFWFGNGGPIVMGPMWSDGLPLFSLLSLYSLFFVLSLSTATISSSSISSSQSSNGVVLNGDMTSSDNSAHHGESGGGGSGGSGGALEEARIRYKNSVNSFRTILATIPNSHKISYREYLKPKTRFESLQQIQRYKIC